MGSFVILTYQFKSCLHSKQKDLGKETGFFFFCILKVRLEELDLNMGFKVISSYPVGQSPTLDAKSLV